MYFPAIAYLIIVLSSMLAQGKSEPLPGTVASNVGELKHPDGAILLLVDDAKGELLRLTPAETR